jgi:hypothetical protein
MKKILLLLAIITLSFVAVPYKSIAQTNVYVSYQEFYDALSPYGQWINDSEYGYVWMPNMDDDFRPYFTGGYWAMTEYGNTWVSDYPWGWACFHYGRWVYNSFYGWIWIPGSEWGPGWVAWRWGDGFCGWAPLYPGIEWYGAGFNCPEDWWIFMHPRYLYKHHYHNVWRSDFWRGPHHTHHIIGHTKYVTRTYEGGTRKFYAGPQAADVQAVTHQAVPVMKMGNASTRGADNLTGNVLNSYRPAKIEPVIPDGNRPAPSNVMSAPQPVNRNGDVQTNWDQHRPFRENLQRQNPTWNRSDTRSAPPYNNQAQPVPRPAVPNIQHAPAVRPTYQNTQPARQPAPRQTAPPARQPSQAPGRR